MDLRDKSSKRQRFVELLLRFRLIPLFGWLVGYFFFAPDFDDFISYILTATERFAIAVSGLFDKGISGAIDQVIPVVIAAAIIFVVRLVFGGIRSAVTFAIALACFLMLIFGLDGSEEVILYIWGVVGVLSFILLLLVRHAYACTFFPLFLLTFIFTNFCVVANVPEMTWGAFMILIFTDAFVLALSAGNELALGTPVVGAITKSFKKQFLPMVFSAVAVAVVMAFYEMHSFNNFPMDLALRLRDAFAFGFLICFGLVPLLSLAPLNRLRAKGRRMKI